MFLVVHLLVNHHEKVISESVDLLGGVSKRTARLWLANGRDFQIDSKRGEVDPLCGVALSMLVALSNIGVECALDERSDGFAVSDSVQ